MLKSILRAISAITGHDEDVKSIDGALQVTPGVSGVPDYRVVGDITSRVKVPFPQGITYLLVTPRGTAGTGKAKVACGANSDGQADSWLAQADSATTNMQHRKIACAKSDGTGGEPGEKREFFFPEKIYRVDLLGDADVTSTELMGI